MYVRGFSIHIFYLIGGFEEWRDDLLQSTEAEQAPKDDFETSEAALFDHL